MPSGLSILGLGGIWRALLVQVLKQVGDAAELEFVLGGEVPQLGQARHSAIGVHYLNYDGGGLQAGCGGKRDAGFGVALAGGEALRVCHDREYVAGTGQVGRLGIGGCGKLDGLGAIGGGYAGLDALLGVYGDSEVGVVRRVVFRHHQGQLKLLAFGGGERQTDQPAGLAHHKVNRRRGDFLRRHYDIAFVLAFGSIAHHHHFAGGYGGYEFRGWVEFV